MSNCKCDINCKCGCKIREVILLLLDASREISEKRQSIEDLFDCDIEIFDKSSDKISDAITALLEIEKYSHTEDGAYHLIYDYAVGIRDDQIEVINELLSL